MVITKKHLDRRQLLKGMGATLALPLLDAMVPALLAQAKSAARPISRVGFVYIPHGAIMSRWTPATEGAGFEFTPILKPLEPFRSQVTVVSGLGHRAADSTAVHSLSPTTWLSGVRPKPTQGVDAYAGITADQIAARRIGQDTLLPSMELATEDQSGLIGACDRDYGCIYMNTLSWRTPTTPMPKPWIARPTRKTGMVGAKPATRRPIAKTTTPTSTAGLGPRRSLHGPTTV